MFLLDKIEIQTILHRDPNPKFLIDWGEDFLTISSKVDDLLGAINFECEERNGVAI